MRYFAPSSIANAKNGDASGAFFNFAAEKTRLKSLDLTQWHDMIEGADPSALLDTHPSEEFLAMQVLPSGKLANERAAIWDTRSRKIHWNPGNANALSWIEGGGELFVLPGDKQKMQNKANVKIGKIASLLSERFLT